MKGGGRRSAGKSGDVSSPRRFKQGFKRGKKRKERKEKREAGRATREDWMNGGREKSGCEGASPSELLPSSPS